MSFETEIRELTGQYWDIAFHEGKSGKSNGDLAGKILHNIEEAVSRMQAEVEALRKNAAWIPVSERLPDGGVTVLACYKNSIGNVRRIRAMWTPAKSSEASSESDFGEYDEASDTYYDPEGWYEKIDNAVDYSAMFVSEVVTHWMPLPKPLTAIAKDTQEQ